LDLQNWDTNKTRVTEIKYSNSHFQKGPNKKKVSIKINVRSQYRYFIKFYIERQYFSVVKYLRIVHTIMVAKYFILTSRQIQILFKCAIIIYWGYRNHPSIITRV